MADETVAYREPDNAGRAPAEDCPAHEYPADDKRFATESPAGNLAAAEGAARDDASRASTQSSHADAPRENPQREDEPTFDGQLALDLGPEFALPPIPRQDIYERAIIVDGEVPEKPRVSTQDKIKGAGQMVAGATLAAVGVPAMVIPIAPSSLMIAGGATLAARGQRTFSGRQISKFEEKAEVATEKLTVATKKTTGSLLSRLGEASTRAAQRLSETDWDERLGLDDEDEL